MPAISALPAATTPAGTEELPVVQGGSTKRVTVTQVSPVRSVAGRTGAVTLSSTDLSDASSLFLLRG